MLKECLVEALESPSVNISDDLLESSPWPTLPATPRESNKKPLEWSDDYPGYGEETKGLFKETVT